MDLFFVESDAAPLPPQETRLRQVRARSQPDGRRVRLELELTPFLERPNIDVVLLGEDGASIASAAVIENVMSRLALTLHVRDPHPSPKYKAVVSVSYREHGETDRKEVEVELDRADEDQGDPS
jgi:hypothetical protein